MGIQATVPTPPAQKLVMSLIYDDVKAGRDGTPKFAAVHRELLAQGCDCGVLACTELSVFADRHHLPPFYTDAMAVPWPSGRSRLPQAPAASSRPDGGLRQRHEKVSVIVDYAHNRLSFETLFRSVREEYPGKRIVTVFGCPGYKAYDRRKDLGRFLASIRTWSSSPRRTPARSRGKHLQGHRPIRGAGRLRVLHRPQPGRGHPPGSDELRRALRHPHHRQGSRDPPEAGHRVY